MLVLVVWAALTVAAPALAEPLSALWARAEDALGWSRVAAEDGT